MKLNDDLVNLSFKQKKFWLLKKINRLSILELLLPLITHELNNALGLMMLELESSSMNAILQKKMDRIAELSFALQRYAMLENKPGSFPLHDCLEEALQISSPALKNKILINQKRLGQQLLVAHHFFQLKQALINIFLYIAEQHKNTPTLQTLKISTKQDQTRLKLIFHIPGEKPGKLSSSLELSQKLIEEYEGKMIIEAFPKAKLKFKMIISLPRNTPLSRV